MLYFSHSMMLITLCSLQITPACNLPLKSLRGGGKIVIVNLQVFLLVPSALTASLEEKGKNEKEDVFSSPCFLQNGS